MNALILSVLSPQAAVDDGFNGVGTTSNADPSDT